MHQSNAATERNWNAAGATPATERHYSIKEVAELWGLSDDTVQKLFEDAEGVLKISMPRKISGRQRKPKVSLRIPASVLERVHHQQSSGFTLRKGDRGRR